MWQRGSWVACDGGEKGRGGVEGEESGDGVILSSGGWREALRSHEGLSASSLGWVLCVERVGGRSSPQACWVSWLLI